MRICDKCGKNGFTVKESKYDLTLNDKYLFTLHADFCKKCCKILEKNMIKEMNIKLKS